MRYLVVFLTLVSSAAFATPGTITPAPRKGTPTRVQPAPAQNQDDQDDVSNDDGAADGSDVDDSSGNDQNADDGDGYPAQQAPAQNQNRNGNGNGNGFPARTPRQGQNNNQNGFPAQNPGQNNNDDDWGDDQGDQNQQQPQVPNNGDRYDRNKGQQPNGRPNGRPSNGQPDYGKNPPRTPQRRQPPRGRRQPIVRSIPVNQQFLGFARLPLGMLMGDMQQLQGYRLVGITINGSSELGSGAALFCGSYCGQEQFIPAFPGSYPIQGSGEPINQGSAQWFLELRGNFMVQSIELQFAR